MNDRGAALLTLIRLMLSGCAFSFAGGAARVFSDKVSNAVWCAGAFLTIILALLLRRTLGESRDIIFDGEEYSFANGILFKRSVRLCAREVCSVKTVQTPLQRLFGMMTVIFRTENRAYIAADIRY